MNENIGRLQFVLGIILIVFFIIGFKWINNDRTRPSPVTPTTENVIIADTERQEVNSNETISMTV